ncbi:MAG: adenylate/guanylate cyclase domain-containing protein, partial [Moraxellaceae bacterium]
MLKPKLLSKGSGICQFDYPEVFVLILTVILLALHYNFRPTSMALLVVVLLPSLMILIYNYRRQTSLWTSNMVVILFAVVIGSIQFCTVISLSLVALIGVRMIVSGVDNALRLFTVALVTSIVFYYVSTILDNEGLNCNEGWVPPTVLLASIMVILYQFRSTYQEYIGYKESASKAGGRLSTMVSVINKLTRFVPPQIWEPIVRSDSPVSVSNKRAKLTIMFSDIVGFTELSDSLSADNLADIL